MAIYKIEIPMKLPSCNEYINACRTNKYLGAKMKAETEDEICFYIAKLPEFINPVVINFRWVEKTKRRDLDGICFAKKFILDALVKSGKLKDDNRRYVQGFTDSFEYGKEAKVVLEIQEVNNERLV